MRQGRRCASLTSGRGHVNETAPAWDLEYLQVAYRDFVAWRENNSTFQAIAAYDFGGGNFLGDGGAQRISWLSVTHDMDDVLDACKKYWVELIGKLSP